MWFQVLGPVQATRGDAILELGPPQQRAVLAVLIAGAGKPVSPSTLADVLWGDALPSAAAATVQQYVSRLRRLLEPEGSARNAAGVIHRASGGYQLGADEDEVDLLRWRMLTGQARQAVRAGDDAAAQDWWEQAFGLWSGPVAADLAADVRGHPVFAGLIHEHVAALGEASDWALASGRGEVIVEALDRAAAWYPFDEGLHARLLRVLAAAGRRGEALRRFSRLRDSLVRELGIEPGPQLRQAHQAVLAEPAATPPVTVFPDLGTAGDAPPPRQLPSDPHSFAGRESELDRLDRLADDPAPLIVVAGLGGVGKTSLALRWAHTALDRFPDGQLYLDLRAHATGSTPVDPTEALRGFLEALGMPRSHQPSTLIGLTTLYRTLVAGRRMLVVLDNALDEDQVRPLLPAALGCTVLVTSRSYLGGLAVENGARLIELGIFTDTDAHHYLQSRLGKARVDTERDAATTIVDACAGLPLALAICTAWIERNRAFTLAAVAAEIHRRAGLDAFTGVAPGRDVRAVFAASYRQLAPDAAELFRCLSHHPGTEIALSTTMSVIGRGRTETLGLLAELCNAQLLTEHRPGRYTTHDLVRLYAMELSDPDERYDTTRRIVEHYAQSLVTAARLAAPVRAPVDPGPHDPRVMPWTPADRADAFAWFADEHDNIRAALDLASQEGLDHHVCLLSWGMNGFQPNASYQGKGLVGWDESILITLRALPSAQRLGVDRWLGYLHSALGRGYSQVGQFDEAYKHSAAAVDVGREAGDTLRTASGLMGMAGTLIERNEWPRVEDVEHAAELANEVRALCEEPAKAFASGSSDPRALMAQELTTLCEAIAALLRFNRGGDVAATVTDLRRVIDALHSQGNVRGARHMLSKVARVYEQVGDGTGAIAAYQQALALTPDLDFVDVEYVVSLAACQARFGDHEAATRTVARAGQLMEGSYDAFAERQRARLAVLALDVRSGH
jgi:DNA-binding SARP family transcriptional activator/tetratricopeptide (TPR) repeat protein